MGRERSAFHAGPEDRPPTKAEYIRVDHIVISFFAGNRAADHTFRIARHPGPIRDGNHTNSLEQVRTKRAAPISNLDRGSYSGKGR
jgi:hypothetical protein